MSKQREEWAETSIEEFNWTTRVRNIFAREGILTLGDIAVYEEVEFSRLHQAGRKSINEIKEVLHSLGLHFGMERCFQGTRLADGEPVRVSYSAGYFGRKWAIGRMA